MRTRNAELRPRAPRAPGVGAAPAEDQRTPQVTARPRHGRSAGRRVIGRAGWLAAGFLLGVAFWHVVGFWNFVGTVVLNTPKDRSAFELAITRAGEAKPAPTEISAAEAEARRDARHCTALVIDRATNIARARPCRPIIRALRPTVRPPEFSRPWVTAQRGADGR